MVSRALDQLPFFCNLPATQLKALSAIMSVDSFPGSSVIFHEGELEDQLFLLLEGAVSVYAGAPPAPWGDGPPDASRISHHEAAGAGVGVGVDDDSGLWVGEMALWANRPPNASVVATVSSKLLILTQARPRPPPRGCPLSPRSLPHAHSVHPPFGQVNFDRFMAAVPEFRALFTTHSNAFARLTQLTYARQQLFGSSIRGALAYAFRGSSEDRSIHVSRSAAELLILRRWERLTKLVLEHGRVRGPGLEAAERLPCTLSFEIEDFECARKGTTKAAAPLGPLT